MRTNCIGAFADHLRSLNVACLPEFAVRFREFFLSCVDNDNHRKICHFIFDDGMEMPPVVVYSRITPDQNTKFALHLLLVLGEYDTELDFKKSASFRDSFVKAGLFEEVERKNVTFGCIAVDNLLKRVILEVIPVQPVSTKKLDAYIVRSHRVLQSMLLDDCVPLLDLPPCLQTQLYADKHSEMMKCWEKYRVSQIKSMLEPLQRLQSLPDPNDVLRATKEKPVSWDPLVAIPKLDVQSEESFLEQQYALGIGKRAVDHYLQSLGSKKITKGTLFNGAPGAGKTYLLQTVGLYAMCMGLRVMTTALMAVRARSLGGINLHQLFRWDGRNNGNLF